MKTVSYEPLTYDGIDYKFPVLDYQGVSYCLKCGRCCWDWKGDRKESERRKEKCEHLAEDMRTCLVFRNPSAPGACGGLDSNWPQPRHFVDLPPDCGYVLLWRGKKLI